MGTAVFRLLEWFQGQFLRLRRLGWHEVAAILVALFAALSIYLFIELTDEVKEGDTRRFDEWVLRSLRRADDPGVPIGPSWLREAGLDATALGSPLVLVLVVTVAVGLVLLQRRYRVLWLIVLSTAGGTLLSSLLKQGIERERPTVVPHLREVSTPSFPSGHAMLSAVVYLTLGILLMQVVRGRLTKLYCLLWALFLTFLVGMSRIYLGVHYPTDVLAGWIAGLVWALACWVVAQCLRRRGARTGETEIDGAPGRSLDKPG
jgi:undecaprenyl-diphosphatase